MPNDEIRLQMMHNGYLLAILNLMWRCELRNKAYMIASDAEVGLASDPRCGMPQRLILMDRETRISVVPWLCKIGYSVLIHPLETQAPFTIFREGYSLSKSHTFLGTYMRSTARELVAMRGILWCVPRFLRWKHRALTTFRGNYETLLSEAVTFFKNLNVELQMSERRDVACKADATRKL
jgi:hypothetical protein